MGKNDNDLELLDEIDDLKEKIEGLENEIKDLKDDKERILGEFEDKLDSEKNKIIEEWRQKLKNLDRDSREKNEAILKELDSMRQAFAGDPGGWELKTTKNGMEYYENADTGEIREDEPEGLYIARAMKRIESADAMMEEYEVMKKQLKDNELKRREAELNINKVKSELNSLRNMDKLWKNASKSIHQSLTTTQGLFDVQMDQIIGGLTNMEKAGKRMKVAIPVVSKLKEEIAQLQRRVRNQETEIMSLNSKIRSLETELDDSQKKVARLSSGIEEEVERLCKPIRDRFSETMVQIMKEKATRAQERRELADIWPSTHLLPSILMKYRTLSEDERLRRIKVVEQRNASRALTYEIIANVRESKMWEKKYDDYGRPFYQHKETGESRTEEPEIVNYKPPPGREENGNLSESPENDLKLWSMKTDNRGQVYWQHIETNEIRYICPNEYTPIPTGKSQQQIVSEAAEIVLLHIKNKISRHIEKMKRLKNKALNPLTLEEKAEIMEQRVKQGLPPEEEEPPEHEDDVDDDLSKYQYDMQTIEMLASELDPKSELGKSAEERRINRRIFLKNNDVRSFELSNFAGPNLIEMDINSLTVEQLREITEQLAITEEKIEALLARTRNNLKDFSFVLMDKIAAEDKENQQNNENLLIETRKTERAKLKSELLMQKRIAKRKRRAREKLEEEYKKKILQGQGEELPEVQENNTDKPGDSNEITSDEPVEPVRGPIINTNEEKLDDDVSDVSDIDDDDEELIKAKDPVLLIGDLSLKDIPINDKTEEIVKTVKNLADTSLFAGYTNLKADDLYHDASIDFSLKYKSDNIEDDDLMDDEWLTKSFFLGISKQKVDTVREMTSKEYDPMVGLLNASPISSIRLQIDGTPLGDDNKFEKPFTPTLKVVHEKQKSDYALWRNRQLMGEVLRSQMQQQAVKVAVANRLKELGSAQMKSPSTLTDTHNSVPVEMKIKRVIATNINKTMSGEVSPVFFQFSLSNWKFRTENQRPFSTNTFWNNLTIKSLMQPSKILTNDLVVQLFDGNEISQNILLASGKVYITKVLGANAGSDVVVELPLWDKDNNLYGRVEIKINADYLDIPIHMLDPNSVEKKEFARTNLIPVHDIKTGNRDIVAAEKRLEEERERLMSNATSPRDDDNTVMSDNLNTVASVKGLSVVSIENLSQAAYVPSLVDQQSSFSKIVADLRGDGDNFIKMLVGDVKLQDILHHGHRPNEFAVKKLPNLNMATKFMDKKSEMHETIVNNFKIEIEKLMTETETLLKESLVRAQKNYENSLQRYNALQGEADNARAEVERVLVYISDVRYTAPQPLEPFFEEMKEPSYVPKLPTTGGLDSKGKKKKQIPNPELKDFIDNIELGKCDLKEWEFGEYWPTQAQIVKLSKSIAARNKSIDDAIRAEQQRRTKEIEKWKQEVSEWELSERARRVEFEKRKKTLRRVYLKLDCISARIDRLQAEYSSMETIRNNTNDMMDSNTRAKERFKIMSLKIFLETKRHKKEVKNLKRKLLKCLDARKRALDLPGTAQNRILFEQYKSQAEEALRTLRFEIADVKELLVAEGVKTRHRHEEEFQLCQNEVTRLRMIKEFITQRESLDKFIARNRYEVINLLRDSEKLKVMEAERDERGQKGTIDNAGERYAPDKEWESEEVTKCQRLIDLVMAKIVVGEGVLVTSAYTQKNMLECLSTKWSTESLSVRDNWIENSDYQRAENLMRDCTQWLTTQYMNLRNKEKELKLESKELRLRVSAAEDQLNVSFKSQDAETSNLVTCTNNVVTVMQKQIAQLRDEYANTKKSLESALNGMSRECQNVREKLLAQTIESEEKWKTLWGFISFLQRSVQQISAKMDILTEESQKKIIATKLVADSTKHQLRDERKHCANLLYIIHTQQSSVKLLKKTLEEERKQVILEQNAIKEQQYGLRNEVWQHLFAFTRLCTDVDALFDFFVSRLANLAGSRKAMNDQFSKNNAAQVLAALTKSPRPFVRKYAARALGGMGWDGYVETRILLWDCVNYWKSFKSIVTAKEQKIYDQGFEVFRETGKEEALLNVEGHLEEFIPGENMSIRTLIKQRRQWALRNAKRIEGPNFKNQKLLNVKDGVIPDLLELCIKDGDVDWEISRNAALAICMASYELSNHKDMVKHPLCVKVLVAMCYQKDFEVQMHAAVTIANLCHKNEEAQAIFGAANAIPALLSMCTTNLTDLLEASTAALANMTCQFDPNCQRAIEADGIQIMVTLISQAYTENLLDLDQNDEIQANAAEMLTNVTRYGGKGTTKVFNSSLIDTLIVMCASDNKQVRRNVPLVLGNISQNESCRCEIGDRGGIEALFLILEDPDNVVQANALWALSNLMWYPPNQERAGRFMKDVLQCLQSKFEPIYYNSSTLLANMLYYNNGNRVRFLETDGAIDEVIQVVREKKDKTAMEGALRSLLSLSYLDHVAAWLGVDGQCVPLFVSLLNPPLISVDVMRYSAEILLNMCLHHSNRQLIVDSYGIEALVHLQSDSDEQIRNTASKIINHLEDITPPEVLARMKSDIGLERMVTLASDPDPLIRAVAAESIGEEIWSDPNKQKRANDIGGMDALLAMAANAAEAVESLLPALWSIRNLLNNNPEGQNQFNYRDGIGVIIGVLGRSLTGMYVEETEKLIEASLACLVTAIVNHERNSRRLLVVGLEVIMDLAEGKPLQTFGADIHVRNSMKSEGILALAKSLLLMLGPYNYVVCKNCHKKQDLQGTACYHCGYRLLVEVADSAEKKEQKLLKSKEIKNNNRMSKKLPGSL